MSKSERGHVSVLKRFPNRTGIFATIKCNSMNLTRAKSWTKWSTFRSSTLDIPILLIKHQEAMGFPNSPHSLQHK